MAGDFHQRGLVEQGFSEAAARLVANSVRKSSGVNYEYKTGLFVKWCNRQIPPIPDPRTASPKDVCHFLAEIQQKSNLGQSSLGGYRSAISKIHNGWYGIPLGSHPTISKLIKGIGVCFPLK